MKQSKSQVIRVQVRALLQRSAGYEALPADQQKILARDTVCVARFLSDGGGLTTELGLRLTQRRGSNEFARSVISRVDFPGFVAGLIHGVFDAIVTSSIEQMQAYGELIAGAATQIDEFLNDNKKRGDDYLAQRWPNWFSVSSDGKFVFQAASRADAIREVLAILAP